MIDANRILTDLLVSFRRIVHRGLINYSGELWYREGLPSDVFRRLVIRKETETPLDRFSGDYEELITYASFQDLADIIAGNDVLRERLGLLNPSDGVDLIDRLYEFEDLRRAVARKSPLNEADTEMLMRYYDDFRQAIKSGRKISQEEPGQTPRIKREPEDEPETDLIPQEETLDSIFGPDEPSKPTTSPGSGRLVVKISANDLRTMASEQTPTTDVTDEPKTPTTDVSEMSTPTTDVVGAPKTPITDVSTNPQVGEDEPQGPLDVYAALERAIEDGDDAMILKSLHAEVTEIADGMLRRDPMQGRLVWEMAVTSGWFDSKTDGYGLQTLEIFYTLADEYMKAYDDEAKASDLKKMLSDAEFSKVLLALREMFLDSRSRA